MKTSPPISPITRGVERWKGTFANHSFGPLLLILSTPTSLIFDLRPTNWRLILLAKYSIDKIPCMFQIVSCFGYNVIQTYLTLAKYIEKCINIYNIKQDLLDTPP
jgi:hypothetical protein